MNWKDRWTTIVQKIEIVDSPAVESTLLATLADSAAPQVLGFVNAHAMNRCAADAAFFEALSSADVLLRDGSGMAIMYRQAHRESGLNMNGTDFIPKILAAFRGRGVAFWGTQDPYLSQAIINGERQFGIRVVSREDGFKDFAHYLRLARQSAPELIVLGMGMPKQEQLARELKGKVHGAPLIVCGGAVLDFLGGKVDRAPPLMRNAGLEWMYRLAREPRRLFHRYVVGNPAFLVKVLAWTRARSHG